MDLANKMAPNELLQKFKEKGLPENFCIIPFVNLIFNPGGKISVCRQKGTQHIVGDLDKDTISEIWNSKYLQNWREEFLTGKVNICKKEITNNRCNLGAKNYEYFEDVYLKKEIPLPMQKFTANFNGQCNLECIMCDVWKMPNGYYDKGDFWEKAQEEFFPHIKELELLSGEPFVQKDTYKLIENISKVNPECWWSFTTNAHWALTPSIESKLDKIKIKNMHLSIDSFDPKTYSVIRKKGNLAKVLKNLEDLKNYESKRLSQGKSDLGMALHFLVMKQNWKEIPTVIDNCNKYNIDLILDVLVLPSNLSILSEDEDVREQIISWYFENLSRDELKRSMRVILPLVNSFKNIRKINYYKKLQEDLCK